VLIDPGEFKIENWSFGNEAVRYRHGRDCGDCQLVPEEDSNIFNNILVLLYYS